MNSFRKTGALLALLLLAFPASLLADTFYTIYIGTFLNAKLSDFQDLQTIGYVYEERHDDALVKVYLGGFLEESTAQERLKRVKAAGYADAYVSARQMKPGEEVYVIQLGLVIQGKPVNWQKYKAVDQLHAHLQGQYVKMVTGPFTNKTAAVQALPAIRAQGYRDAFVKTAHPVSLKEVSAFERGAVMVAQSTQRRIDRNREFTEDLERKIEYGTTAEVVEKAEEEKEDFVLFTFENGEEVVLEEKNPPAFQTRAKGMAAGAITSTAPDIRSNVRRQSVKDLQTILKKEGVYKSTLDGFYGPGTTKGYTEYKATHPEIRKYLLLAREMPSWEASNNSSRLEGYINQLIDNPDEAMRGLEVNQEPIAKAYRAYYYFANRQNPAYVNELMNTAIREAFRGKNASGLAFDPTATYAYQDLDQLLLHLSYIQRVSEPEPAAPCWLFELHPQAASRAYSSGLTALGTNYRVQQCDHFLEWEDLALLNTIAADLCPNPRSEATQGALEENAAERTRIFLSPAPLAQRDKMVIENWHKKLWNGMDKWSEAHPLNQKKRDPLRAAYAQSQVLLEDYFMDNGLNADQARSMALYTLYTLIDPYLKAYYS